MQWIKGRAVTAAELCESPANTPSLGGVRKERLVGHSKVEGTADAQSSLPPHLVNVSQGANSDA